MSKRAVVISAVRNVQSSYWFLPTVLALLAVAGAQISLYLDQNPGSVFYLWPDSWQTTQVEGARATLSVISQSVLGVVGVMFSVAIVAVSFASGTFGPRLIANFMRDRGTQWSLGILIGTFVFSLLILRSVHTGNNSTGDTVTAFVPHLSLGIAMTLMGVSIMTVIFYVHHIPKTINVSHISAELGKKLRAGIEHLIDKDADSEAGSPPPQGDPDHTLDLERNGYIQTFDKSRLIELAEEHDLRIKMTHDVGAFVSENAIVLEVWENPSPDDDLKSELRGCFIVGPSPTEDQNLLFIVQQLVEMIARALSPGVNDPYTAINCLNWIYAGLSTAANYRDGLQQTTSARVWSKSLSFQDVFHSGIVLSYPYIKEDPLTHDHLKRTLKRLMAEMGQCENRDIVADFLKVMDTTHQTSVQGARA